MALSNSPAAQPPRRRPRAGAPGKRAARTSGATFPVVGIGASAGGLEAFRGLLGALPAKSGMAFILVQHLDPTHASMMVELLSPHLAMPIVEASDGAPLEADHVYVIPPGRFLSVRDGALRLSDLPRAPTVRMPFDFLLRSLADAVGEHAVCVILSGTATDGSAGATAIKAASGLVIAQDPEEAEYDGMPRSAIAAGAVDLVLPLAKIPQALVRYGRHRYLRPPEGGEPPASDSFAQIIDLLRKRTSHDFALYKEGTLRPRIERRMALNGIEDGGPYLERLTQDAAELERLADDLLINVTRFFRDAKAFELLEEKVIPEMVRNQPPDRPIRLWVAGSSTGEEAYSLAMLLLDEIAKARRSIKVQIFATDVDADAVAFAREGLYPAAIEGDVPPDRLARYFNREDHGYRISRELRASIVFSVHDLVSDAPFSRLDLVSCRNLLIYLRPEVQQKVIALFHFALREGAVLFLGGSEAVGSAGDHFEPISKVHRIFRHIGRSRPGDVELPLGRGEAARTLWTRPARQAPAADARVSFGDLAQRLLLKSYAPASVLVNRRRQGLYYFGPTDLYLKMSTGEANLDVFASAREGLRPAIRDVIENVAEGRDQTAVARRVSRYGEAVAVSVTARLLTSAGQDLILLSFIDLREADPETEAQPEEALAETSRLARLEHELDASRKELEDAIRDREIAEEEIRAINEEAMSVNEEFQTTNEELETSHEELQSLNEELTALNGQLQETLILQRAAADDLQNILNSSDVATIFLDEKLNIRFFTPGAKALFSVIASDIGRPLADLAHHFANSTLLSDARAVLSSLVPVVREVGADNGVWYNCRTLPYRTKDNRIEGVVITFADISARKRAEDLANAAKLQAESANLGKSRFLSAASHDLRQPLQTLSLLQGLLAKKLKDRDALQLVARSNEALMAMSGMLNTLLDINQLEAGVIRPEVTDFPINDLLEALKAEFGYHTKAKALDWRVLPCRLVIRTDRRLLDQIMRNLLSNAVKYTKRGGLVLGCRRRGDRLRIEVYDTGLGIPAGQLSAIFEEFHQIDNPARELSRGLGLAIVQRLAELLDLTVDVQSREGRGSVFAVEVPLTPPGSRVAPAGLDQDAVDLTPRGGAILVVEDDPALRESLELFLNAHGYATSVAVDGEAAIQLVDHGGMRPDLVIVDFNLPRGLTGLQVMARLRETLAPGVPALVLTGDISTETIREIAAQGYDHRTKPLMSEDLAHLVRRLLSKRPPAAAWPDRRLSASADAGQGPVIFVVDDDAALLDVMSEMLRDNGRRVEAYPSAEAFLEAYRPGAGGCLLVDAVMPGMSGFALLDHLKAAGDPLPAIMITGDGDVRTAVRAMQAGALNFIEKPVGETELLASIDQTLALTRDAPGGAASRTATTARLAGLTVRERQILDLVLAGQPSKNIAADLGISQRTVETHRSAIMRKTGSKSLSELVRLALALA
jgi:two-component system CheB/CheR fusion protein